jgi:hypothetical protein
VVAVVVLVALFLSVHNRDLHSDSFERDYVETRVFQDRWNDLSDYWATDGWWANGGLWCLNSDLNFNRWAENGSLGHWSVEGPLDLSGSDRYYYRSNSAISLVPLHMARQAKVMITGSPGGRWLLVLHNQFIVAGIGLLIGLTATRATRAMGLSMTHALVLGLGVQLVLQTHPLLLMSYFRLYFEHLFLLFGACVLLSATMHHHRLGSVLRFIGVFGMVLADMPLALLALSAWAILNLIGDRAWFRQEGWSRFVLLPAGIGLAVIALQYAFVAVFQDNASFLGSSLLFRTGLDGDATQFGSWWEGLSGFMWGGVFYGPNQEAAGASPLFWVSGLLAVAVVFVIAAFRERFGPMARLVALAGTLCFPFVALFSNAFFIHPFAYPMLLLPVILLSLFAGVPAYLATLSRAPSLLILCAGIMAIIMSASNLRQYAVAFPIDTTQASIQVSVYHHSIPIQVEMEQTL